MQRLLEQAVTQFVGFNYNFCRKGFGFEKYNDGITLAAGWRAWVYCSSSLVGIPPQNLVLSAHICRRQRQVCRVYHVGHTSHGYRPLPPCSKLRLTRQYFINKHNITRQYFINKHNIKYQPLFSLTECTKANYPHPAAPAQREPPPPPPCWRRRGGHAEGRLETIHANNYFLTHWWPTFWPTTAGKF